MLKLRYLFENYDLAKTLLANWEYDDERIDEMLSYFRISSNAIYPFFRDEKVCFLRFAAIDEKKENNIYGELEFIQYLRNNGFNALKPVATKDGEYIIRSNTEYGEYYVSVYERVLGNQLSDIDFTKEIMYEYGKTLGKLHNLSSRFSPKVKKWTHIDVLDWISIELHNYNCTEKIYKELEAVRAELLNIPINSQNYGLVHYDFEPDNVFYDNETKSCSVIDFDDGMYHWFALDIEQCFDSISEEMLINMKSYFIEGYKSEYQLPDETLNLLPLMRRFINLFSYARILRSTSDHFENEPDWMIGLRNKLESMLNQIENNIE